MPGSTSQDSAPVLLAGRYELVSLIGRGGMADVHRARDQVLGREVAVKVLRETGTEESERARFIAEARLLASLSHSGLVTLLDAGLEPETPQRGPEHQASEHDPVQPFVVMELVDGPSLAQVLTRGPLPLAQVESLALQLAGALAYVHGRDVVHRDLKPGNVLLGPGERVRLADFGIARLLGDTARHTRTGQAIGTAAYLAPEQVTGREITGAADIYSLGLVLLEALTGQREYAGPPTEAALARLHRQPAIPADLPPVWRSLLADMTHAEPSRRPDGGQVAARLGDPQAVVTPTAPTAPLPGPTSPPPATRPLSGLDPASRTALATARPGAPRPAPAVSPGPRRLPVALGNLGRSQRIALGVIALVLVVVLVTVVANLAGGGGQPSRPIPSDTPSQLREPLQQLHDAVDGADR